MASKPPDLFGAVIWRSSAASPQPDCLLLIERYGSGGQELIWSVQRNQSASSGRSVERIACTAFGGLYTRPPIPGSCHGSLAWRRCPSESTV